jgi:ankyrin repeat protein
MANEQSIANAVKRGALAQVKELVRASGPIIATDGYGRSVLFYAVEAPDHEILQWLLAEGADTTQTDGYGFTVLMYAIARSHFKGAQWLIECGGASMAAVIPSGDNVWNLLESNLRGSIDCN